MSDLSDTVSTLLKLKSINSTKKAGDNESDSRALYRYLKAVKKNVDRKKSPKMSARQMEELISTRKPKMIKKPEPDESPFPRIPRNFELAEAKEALRNVDYLGTAFTWSSTKEGGEFWSDISDNGHSETSRKILKRYIQRYEKENPK